MAEKRFTFDIDQENGYDEEAYFCDGTDSFYVNNPEEMELFIKEINELVEENKELKKGVMNCLNEMFVKDIKTLLFVLSFCKLPNSHRLSESEKQAIIRLQSYVGESINLKKFNGDDVNDNQTM